MERVFQINTVYTDLTAAFDRVNHPALLNKLELLGTSSRFVQWLKSYLGDRRLNVSYVRVGAYVFASFTNPSRVPQGNNLGPLLFAIFFNDVCFVLPEGCRLIYADDLKILIAVRSIDDCRELQRIVDMFVDWCKRNSLTISVRKCGYLI